MLIKMFVLPVLCLLSLTGLASARELPQGPGIGAGYTGDTGIENHEAVVLFENFEESDLASVFARWNDVSNNDDAVIFFSPDKPQGSGGNKSLQMTARQGINTGGHLFKLLDQGYDELYVRFYTKFSADHGFLHHFVRVRGWTQPITWPNGNLDKSPNTQACGIDIEPLAGIFNPNNTDPPVGAWTLSSFWHGMHSWQGEGGTSFYPNIFPPETAQNADRNRWYCVEAMVKMNSSASSYDGEMALWIDGKLVSHYAPGTVNGYWKKDTYFLEDSLGTPFEGFNWRQNMDLQWNRFWLLYYLSDSAFEANQNYKSRNPEDEINTAESSVLYDHIVIAQEYIGPMAPGQWGALPEGDYDFDGHLSLSDVIRLVVLQYRTPGSMTLDFNRDGSIGLADVISLLLRIRA